MNDQKFYAVVGLDGELSNVTREKSAWTCYYEAGRLNSFKGNGKDYSVVPVRLAVVGKEVVVPVEVMEKIKAGLQLACEEKAGFECIDGCDGCVVKIGLDKLKEATK
jgi:hypothetical protein